MEMMNWVDYVILCIIGISALVSLVRGFVKEALSLLVWVAAVWLAIVYAEDAVLQFGSYIPVQSATLKLGAAFGVILLGVLVIGAMVNFVLSKLVQKTGLASTDRLLGMVFGAARGAALVVIVVLLAGLTPLPSEAWWRSSALLPSFEGLALKAKRYLPTELAEDMTFTLPKPAIEGLPLSEEAPPAAIEPPIQPQQLTPSPPV